MIGNAGRSGARYKLHSVKRSKTHLEVLCNFTNETLEWQFTDEELGRFLVTPNLTKSDSTGAEAMGLLYATCGGL
jgi:hypothetical protein